MRYLVLCIYFAAVLSSCETLIDRLDELDSGPYIKIFKPIDGIEFLENHSVEFECEVSDYRDETTELTVQWISNIDDVFATHKPANEEGRIKFTYSELSIGQHAIEVIVTDTEGNTASAIINILITHPLAITAIDSIVDTPPGLKISWMKSIEPMFKSYRIWRLGILKLVFESDDINELEFLDTEVEVGVEYRYNLSVEYSSGDTTRSPTVSEVYIGPNLKLGTNIHAMVLDPVRPYLYMLDREGDALIVAETETRTIYKTINVGPQPSDLSISLDNSELYVAHWGNNEVQVFDLDLLQLTRSFEIEFVGFTGGELFKLEYMAGGFLAYAGEDQWSEVNLCSGVNGDLIYDMDKNIYEPSLVSNPERTTLYIGESGLSDNKLWRIEVVDSTMVVKEEKNYTRHPSRRICLSGDGDYLFYDRRKILATDFTNELGKFTEDILSANIDGSVVLGTTRLFDGLTFQPIRKLFDFPMTHARYRSSDNSFVIFVSELQTVFFVSID
ncbi:MAG: hypothetical protein DRI69_03320 [Bacteroidetes bacterium]|nr:MAG: hypothetical protein DRI69_03320 [Bacteroidota bacterium]